VIVGALLLVSVVGALQVRQDGRLSERSSLRALKDDELVAAWRTRKREAASHGLLRSPRQADPPTDTSRQLRTTTLPSGSPHRAGCVLGAMMVYLIGFLSAGRPDPLADIISPAPSATGSSNRCCRSTTDGIGRPPSDLTGHAVT